MERLLSCWLRPLPADWIPNEQEPQCTVCARAFSFWVRHHHCRRCFRNVCSRCWDAQKVCQTCVRADLEIAADEEEHGEERLEATSPDDPQELALTLEYVSEHVEEQQQQEKCVEEAMQQEKYVEEQQQKEEEKESKVYLDVTAEMYVEKWREELQTENAFCFLYCQGKNCRKLQRNECALKHTHEKCMWCGLAGAINGKHFDSCPRLQLHRENIKRARS